MQMAFKDQFFRMKALGAILSPPGEQSWAHSPGVGVVRNLCFSQSPGARGGEPEEGRHVCHRPRGLGLPGWAQGYPECPQCLSPKQA